jgi:hypothetical protein
MNKNDDKALREYAILVAAEQICSEPGIKYYDLDKVSLLIGRWLPPAFWLQNLWRVEEIERVGRFYPTKATEDLALKGAKAFLFETFETFSDLNVDSEVLRFPGDESALFKGWVMGTLNDALMAPRATSPREALSSWKNRVEGEAHPSWPIMWLSFDPSSPAWCIVSGKEIPYRYQRQYQC